MATQIPFGLHWNRAVQLKEDVWSYCAADGTGPCECNGDGFTGASTWHSGDPVFPPFAAPVSNAGPAEGVAA